MIEVIGMISTILAVIGVIFNNRQLKICFPIWLVSNGLTLVIHAQAGIYSLAVRDAIFFILAIEGWYQWNKKRIIGAMRKYEYESTKINI